VNTPDGRGGIIRRRGRKWSKHDAKGAKSPGDREQNEKNAQSHPDKRKGRQTWGQGLNGKETQKGESLGSGHLA